MGPETEQAYTVDSQLYSFATMQMERRAEAQIAGAIDTDTLAAWFAEQIRRAYEAGCRDGYVQGRHDKNKTENGAP